MLPTIISLGQYVLAWNEDEQWNVSTDGENLFHRPGPDELIDALAPLLTETRMAERDAELSAAISGLLDRALEAMAGGEHGVTYSDPELPFVLGRTTGEIADYAIATPPHGFIGADYRLRQYGGGVVFRTEKQALLRTEFRSMCLETLRAWAETEAVTEITDALTVVARAVPYTQDCTCENPERGLMANDCHVHTADPMHFFGSIEIDCTCTEQDIAVA